MPKHKSSANFHFRLAKDSLISQIEINHNVLTLLINEPRLSKPRNEFAPFYEPLQTKQSPFKSAKVVKFVQDHEKEHDTLHFNDNYAKTIHHMHIKFDRPVDEKILKELIDWFDAYQNDKGLRKKDQEKRLPSYAVKDYGNIPFNVKDPFLSKHDGQRLLTEFKDYSTKNDQCLPICNPYTMFHNPLDHSVEQFCFGKSLPSSRSQSVTFSGVELAAALSSFIVLAILLYYKLVTERAEQNEQKNKGKHTPKLKK